MMSALVASRFKATAGKNIHLPEHRLPGGHVPTRRIRTPRWRRAILKDAPHGIPATLVRVG
eukprot:8505173-Pyramimonas_sp.AAC.1